MRFPKFVPLVALAAGTVIALGSSSPSTMVAQAKAVAQKSSTLRTGKLPNGMTYYVQYNPMPAKRAFIWLSVNAGAIQEDDDQRGFAHLLEHMAFNGTKNFPGNTLIDVIEKAGMQFGGDLNAYTSFDETVYQLTMPTDDAELFRQGMQIVDDWANQNILNDSLEVVNERGVVLGEWRTRLPDTASERFQREELERMFGKGSRYIDRFPIGLPEQLRAAEAAQLIRYYKDWYRPDNMAIIVVGDFDVDAVEKDVKARFSVTPNPAKPRKFVRPAIAKSNTTVVQLVKDKVPSPRIDISWPAPPMSNDKEATVKLEIIENIVIPFLQRSMTEMAKIEKRPFAAGGAFRSTPFARPVGVDYTIAAVAHPDSIMYGAAVVLSEVERIAQNGIPADELNTAKAALLRQYEGMVDGSTSINSRALATLYTAHHLNGGFALISPEEKLAIAKKILPKITGKDIAAFAKAWRNPKGRLVKLSIPMFSTLRFVEEKNVLAMLDSVQKFKHSPETFLAAKRKGQSGGSADGLTKTVAAAGKIVSAETVANSDVKVWKLSNGSKVVYKKTEANPDEVLLHAYSIGGHTLLPDSLFYGSGRLVAMLMTSSGGFGDMKREDLDKKAATTGLRSFKVAINAFDEEVILRGSPRELELMFQLMHHQFVDPSVDTIALQEWRRAGFGSLEASPNDQMISGISGQHRRLALPQPASVPFMDLKEAMAVYNDRFGNAADFVFYIVGAASEDKVTALVEKYIANLPSNPNAAPETAKDLKIRPPSGGSVNEMELPQQSVERSQLTLNFFNNLPNPKEDADKFTVERQKLAYISSLLTRRLRNKLREEMSVTYGTGASVGYYNIPEPRMYTSIQLVTDPIMMDTSKKVIWQEIEKFQKEGPTAEELAIAKEVRSRALENAMQSNAWWVNQLISAQYLGLPLEKVATPKLDAFTTQEIAETATKYLSKSSYQQQVLKPTKENIKKAKEEAEKKKTDVGKTPEEKKPGA